MHKRNLFPLLVVNEKHVVHAPQIYYSSVPNIYKNVRSKFCETCKNYIMLNGKTQGLRGVKTAHPNNKIHIYQVFLVCKICWHTYSYRYVADYEGFVQGVHLSPVYGK